MACLSYIPKRAVIASHQTQFSSAQPVDLFFNIQDFRVIPKKDQTISRALDGRPCIVGGARTLDMTLSTLSIPKKLLPNWIEFQRSVDCGEEVTVKDLPCLSLWRVKGNGIIIGDVQFTTPPGNKVFRTSFTISFWEFTS